MFIDETGFDKYLTKEYARAPRGEKIIGEISGKKFARTSRVAGEVCGKTIAEMEHKGTMNSELFNVWVEKILLKVVKKGQIIIMDNATFHKSNKTRELIEKAGCILLYLPPYSPDLNPIEKFWSWLKRKIREISGDFKTIQDAIYHALFN